MTSITEKSIVQPRIKGRIKQENPCFMGCIKVYLFEWFSHIFPFSVTEEKIFFDSKRKKRKQHQQAAEMNKRLNKMRKRRISAHALQILHTIHKASSPGDKPHSPKSMKGFVPSSRLQALFDRYDIESDSEDSSSIDYDALALDFSNSGDIYHNLRKMWSMYVINGDVNNDVIENDDVELDIDYDAMITDDFPPTNHNSEVFLDNPNVSDMTRRYSEVSQEKDKQSNSSSIRLALSNPPSILRQELHEANNHYSNDPSITFTTKL